jgi:cation diffusion facilitator CzcD-associated flavoprotein CzcO
MRADEMVNAAYPALRGLEAYLGPKVLLSRGLDGVALRGLRVAVIGVDAHVVRLLPSLVRQAAVLRVFQHTPQWVLPAAAGARGSHGRPIGRGPLRLRLAQWRAKRHLHRQVREPWLRRQLLPQDGMSPDAGVSFSNEFYPALQQPHCELVTWPIDRLCEDGIRTCDGLVHQVDCVIVAG